MPSPGRRAPGSAGRFRRQRLGGQPAPFWNGSEVELLINGVLLGKRVPDTDPLKPHIQLLPRAAGTFCPDLFADNGNGRGITWRLCHIHPRGTAGDGGLILVRFDCDLSRENICHCEGSIA